MPRTRPLWCFWRRGCSRIELVIACPSQCTLIRPPAHQGPPDGLSASSRCRRQWVHPSASSRGTVSMEWSRVEIEMLGAGAPASPSLGVTMPGLDATAEEMHGLFLGNLPHLDDVRAGHDRIFSDVAAPVEMSKSLAREIQPLEELLREFGGSRSDHRIVVPLPSALSDGLIVEKFASERAI